MPIQYSTVSVPHESADFENFEDFWIAIQYSSKPGKGLGCYDYGFNECTCFVGSVSDLEITDSEVEEILESTYVLVLRLLKNVVKKSVRTIEYARSIKY